MTEPDAPVPHPEVRAYLAASGASDWRVDIAELRRQAHAEALAVRGALEPVASVATVDADGVACRLYHPTGGEETVLVWVHGGGWMHGDLDGYDGVARALANRGECAVLAVDYRLAPEHPFPEGLDDVWVATRWAHRNFAAVSIGGDSSGANLAAAAALKARDAGLTLALQLLVYPVLDSTAGTDFKRAFAQRYSSFAGRAGFGPDAYERIEHIWQTYLPDPATRDDALASPLRAGTLRGVCPALVITAEHDILRGESQDFARRLAADQVQVETHNYPGQIHGFFQMLGVMSDAHDALAVAGAGIRKAFAELRGRLDEPGSHR